jgi:hypothetical protein
MGYGGINLSNFMGSIRLDMQGVWWERYPFMTKIHPILVYVLYSFIILPYTCSIP